MIRPGKIGAFENVRSAIECRYLFDAIVDDELMKATQRQLKASLFEFVTDNKTTTKDNQRKELTTVSLPNSNINSAGDLSPFANLLVLDLTASLIPTWNVVADIVKQLPRLEHLDLTYVIFTFFFVLIKFSKYLFLSFSCSTLVAIVYNYHLKMILLNWNQIFVI